MTGTGLKEEVLKETTKVQSDSSTGCDRITNSHKELVTADVSVNKY